jgi:energy-coupling factor transporter transmembrane protein EcfT
MDRDISPFAYTCVSRGHLPAGLKLVMLLVVSSAAFIFDFYFLIPAMLCTVLLALFRGIRPRALFRGSRSLLLSAGLVILLRSLNFTRPWFSPGGFIEGLRFGLSLMLCFLAAALFFSVTTQGELLRALAGPELFIRRMLLRREARPVLSLAISLMLGFIPRFFRIWDEREKAYRARGGRRGFAMLRLLIPPAAEAMLNAAADTGKALEARGF